MHVPRRKKRRPILCEIPDVWHNLQSLRENHLDVGEGVGSFNLDRQERKEMMLSYFDLAISVYEERKAPKIKELRKLYNLI